MTRHILDAALMLGRRVGPIFPTVAGKPRCAHGYKDATREPERIEALWASCPDANISVAMGNVSGLLGLDVDMKGGRDGIASLASLQAKHGPLPPTPHYTTPSGGLGYLFAHPACRVATRFDFRPGLELHSDGAAMTLPPSQKEGRPYVWIVTPRDVPFTDVPLWLLAAARPPDPPARDRKPFRIDRYGRAAKYVAAAINGECTTLARMGRNSGRNRQLFIAAARLGELVGADLLRRDMAEDALEVAAQDCGLAGEDGWRSVRATIASGLARGIQQPREVTL